MKRIRMIYYLFTAVLFYSDCRMQLLMIQEDSPPLLKLQIRRPLSSGLEPEFLIPDIRLIMII